VGPGPEPRRACKANEIWRMCGACDGTCGRPDVMCAMNCRPGGCGCNYGYVRDERTNKCIPLKSCPRQKHIFDEDEVEDGCTPDNFYSFISRAEKAYPTMPRYKDQPEWLKVCSKAVFNEVCDECGDDVNCFMTRGRKVSPTMPECHQPRRLVASPWNFDEDDEEDECSTRNFDRVLVHTVGITGRAPNPACARAVFDKICDQCEDNIQCYLKLGRQVGPKTPQCQPPRLRRA